MSAIDLIIARGFGPEIRDNFTAAQRGENYQRAEMDRRRDADQRASANEFDLAAAQQNQAAALQGRARTTDLQTEQDALIGEIQAINEEGLRYMQSSQPPPPDLLARAAAVQAKAQALSARAAAPQDLASTLYPPPKATSQAKPVIVAGPDGRPVYVAADEAVGRSPYMEPKAPAAPAAPPKPPAGYIWNDPSNPAAGVTAIQGGPQDPNTVRPPSAEERKLAAQARQKLPRVKALDRRLDRLDAAVNNTAGLLIDTGPVDQYAARLTPAGQELTAASAQILDELTALTRIPGVGTQSDLETRLKALTLPSLELAPEVNKRNAAEIREFAADLRRAIESVAAGSSGPADPLGIR